MERLLYITAIPLMALLGVSFEGCILLWNGPYSPTVGPRWEDSNQMLQHRECQDKWRNLELGI